MLRVNNRYSEASYSVCHSVHMLRVNNRPSVESYSVCHSVHMLRVNNRPSEASYSVCRSVHAACEQQAFRRVIQCVIVSTCCV